MTLITISNKLQKLSNEIYDLPIFVKCLEYRAFNAMIIKMKYGLLNSALVELISTDECLAYIKPINIFLNILSPQI